MILNPTFCFYKVLPHNFDLRVGSRYKMLDFGFKFVIVHLTSKVGEKSSTSRVIPVKS